MAVSVADTAAKAAYLELTSGHAHIRRRTAQQRSLGVPGWQIALIAAGAALLTATLAVLADRVRTAHRKTAPAS